MPEMPVCPQRGNQHNAPNQSGADNPIPALFGLRAAVFDGGSAENCYTVAIRREKAVDRKWQR
ncbi:MAG: hypothetical protein GY820_39830 [Gammaproteobacteria bacterium]|nr:hypothetical protein [Gammaproteobacteria bacterium]